MAELESSQRVAVRKKWLGRRVTEDVVEIWGAVWKSKDLETNERKGGGKKKGKNEGRKKEKGSKGQ